MRFCRKYCGCHQMPERSYFIGEYQFPLCARCMGIVIGHAAGIAASCFHKSSWKSLFLTLPLMADGCAQKFTSYESTNPRRLCTGILYGYGMMSACIYGIKLTGNALRRLLRSTGRS